MTDTVTVINTEGVLPQVQADLDQILKRLQEQENIEDMKTETSDNDAEDNMLDAVEDDAVVSLEDLACESTDS